MAHRPFSSRQHNAKPSWLCSFMLPQAGSAHVGSTPQTGFGGLPARPHRGVGGEGTPTRGHRVSPQWSASQRLRARAQAVAASALRLSRRATAAAMERQRRWQDGAALGRALEIGVPHAASSMVPVSLTASSAAGEEISSSTRPASRAQPCSTGSQWASSGCGQLELDGPHCSGRQLHAREAAQLLARPLKLRLGTPGRELHDLLTWAPRRVGELEVQRERPAGLEAMGAQPEVSVGERRVAGWSVVADDGGCIGSVSPWHGATPVQASEPLGAARPRPIRPGDDQQHVLHSSLLAHCSGWAGPTR